MATSSLLPILAALILPPPTATVDLTQIDRSLVKEPTYQTRLPKYCLLVFGPQAKARVWVVLDGHDLYLDRNGNGDLTEPGECVRPRSGGRWRDYPAVSFQDADGQSRQISFRTLEFNPVNGKCGGLTIVLDGKRRQFVGFDETNPFEFAQRPQQAPIVHLEGPLMLRLWGKPPTLVAGQAVELNVSIGTPGVGPGSFAAIQCCTVLEHKVSPVADLEFPRRAPDSPPLKARVAIADD